MNHGGGGKGGTITITDGKHSNLNIGKESRVQIANAMGKELHHPIMSKLWNSETGPTDRDILFISCSDIIVLYMYGML